MFMVNITTNNKQKKMRYYKFILAFSLIYIGLMMNNEYVLAQRPRLKSNAFKATKNV